MPALPFHRVKEEMDEMVLLAKTKVPPRAQTILVICAAVLAVLLIGLLIGLAARPSSCSGPECRTPVYYFVTNHSASCPAVSGELMVTSVAEGASFEGLVVLVQVRWREGCTGAVQGRLHALPHPHQVPEEDGV